MNYYNCKKRLKKAGLNKSVLGVNFPDYFNKYGIIYTIFSIIMCRILLSTNQYLL